MCQCLLQCPWGIPQWPRKGHFLNPHPVAHYSLSLPVHTKFMHKNICPNQRSANQQGSIWTLKLKSNLYLIRNILWAFHQQLTLTGRFMLRFTLLNIDQGFFCLAKLSLNLPTYRPKVCGKKTSMDYKLKKEWQSMLLTQQESLRKFWLSIDWKVLSSFLILWDKV